MTRRWFRRRRGTGISVLAILLLSLAAVVCARTGALTPTTTQPDAAAPTTPGVRATVSRVVDGDTIHVLLDGRDYTVRYIGIDTPETVAPGRPVEAFGREASARNKELVDGKTVTLEKDVSETDRFGRLLRYVYVDGEMVNATLVKEGFATSSTYPPDVKHQELFKQLEREAREAKRGLWGK